MAHGAVRGPGGGRAQAAHLKAVSIDGREAGAGESLVRVRAVGPAQEAQKVFRRQRRGGRQGEARGSPGPEGRSRGRVDKDPGGKLKGVEGVGVDDHEGRGGGIAGDKLPQDADHGVGDAVDQGGAAEAGGLGQLLTPGVELGGMFPAAAVEIGKEALGFGGPGPEGGAVPGAVRGIYRDIPGP